jgi:hypothetical protein
MKVLGFSFLLATLFFGQIACSSKKNATSATVEQSSNTSPVDKSDSLFATLERGYCFGTCPVYKIEIYQSGYAVYTGKANTEMIGIYTSRFSKEQLSSLTKVAKEVNYTELNDVYDSPITDLPSHTTSIVIDGKRKEVKRRHNYPESILKFEQKIDELAESAKWIFVSKLEE